LISASGSVLKRRIQIRADSFKGDRPDCPRGCQARLHRHGWYYRYKQPTGTDKFAVLRFLCPECGHTVSILLPNRLTYRPLEVKQLQAHFDGQAEVSSGLDPPPDAITAGCLQRAWNRFLTRVEVLKTAFGQMLPAVISTPPHLWQQLRQCVGTAEQMLAFLAQHGKRSLLGDYACLQPAP
jgi:hypothetical protein